MTMFEAFIAAYRLQFESEAGPPALTDECNPQLAEFYAPESEFLALDPRMVEAAKRAISENTEGSV